MPPSTSSGAVHGAPLVVVGCGFVGRALLNQARESGRSNLVATTRDPARREALSELGADVVVLEDQDAWARLAARARGGDCVVTFPADPAADALAAEVAREARAAVYVSSTAVYGALEGAIDDRTPASETASTADDRARRRLAAEDRYREVGATVLRAPGIYGPGRGVHRRLLRGTFSLVGDGARHISRIHVDDLAGCILAALSRDAAVDPGEGDRPAAVPAVGTAHVVGDLRPSPQRELVGFLCERLGLPMPGSIPIASAHATLRGNRQVDPRPALDALGYRLRYPDYVSGYGQVLADEGVDVRG